MSKSGCKPKILYVEDNQFQQEIISLILIKAGFEVKTALNGQEGVAFAREWLPDLILMDIMMPVMNGIEATKVLRADARTHCVPILGLTAVVEEIQVEFEAAGIDELLEKTITPTKLLKQVCSYLTESR